ncbi:hypothetical protein [Pseudomonas sp. CGJS7]|uniref:hypothetical protein n=1 Tax=Pseudomonas sp. CGJS7 TaxID=3109348 RepID=UPI003007F2D0
MMLRVRPHRLIATALPCALALAPLCAQAQSIQRESAAIDWPTAQQQMRDAAERDKPAVEGLRSSPTLQETLDRVSLPVLVPGTGPVRAAPAVIEQGTAYAADYPLDGADLVVLGSASALALPPDSAMAKLLAESGPPPQYQFEAYEYGADLSFIRYGASYVLRVACEQAEDPRCDRDEFLRKVAESLIAVGGKPR